MPLPAPEIKLRSLTLADIPLGMRLKELAHWNQLEKDWEFLIKSGEGGNFAASYGGKDAGTLTTLFYPERFSWIGMVLVDPQFRGLGIGQALLTAAIKQAENKGTIRLDATPQGRQLYEKLGFVAEREIIRMQRTNLSPIPLPLLKPEPVTPSVLNRLALLDAPVFGADRQAILNYLSLNAPEYAWYTKKSQEITGYCLGRHGHYFEQLGPIVAQNPEDAHSLLLAALGTAPGKSFILDTGTHNKTWLAILEKLGFTPQRTFLRMYRGQLLYPGNPDFQYAIAGPELG
ncbi:GNAT family N-acetyltransferase [Adhaeribacter rhizoryzae]|uniref:GNAT family N-acetyltransferase n=1 Tax=Adhaeribacter rhizoryzae TaxID=2607907 RepID=A0A5M6D2C8_9BACT|nr:GNAT family N-acetyltransferase [Adhaeribacter rhizoryzae]KAA5541628.1 GNAT family N-acetyltransferase [Adhaeribacter rhizoryzae]